MFWDMYLLSEYLDPYSGHALAESAYSLGRLGLRASGKP